MLIESRPKSGYYEFQQGIQTCHCGWTGLGSETGVYESFDDLYEVACPKCEEKIGICEYPYSWEAKENPAADRVDKLAAELIESRSTRFEREKLKSPDQLPDIDGDSIILTWDTDSEVGPGNVLIQHGNKLIWKEMEWFEGFTRFIEIAGILKNKYGDRLNDLVPSPRSEMDLYGDHLGGPTRVDECRRKLRENEKIA